jgi:Zn-dependent protease with chaperone function
MVGTHRGDGDYRIAPCLVGDRNGIVAAFLVVGSGGIPAVRRCTLRPIHLVVFATGATFRAIIRRNDLARRRFVLAIVDTESLNAFACGGHLVIVSSLAVEQLDKQQLSGVLAHELSHHLGLHTVSLTITQWMILPITVLSRIGMRLQALAESATIAFARRIPLLHALGLFVAAFLHVASWLLMLNVSLATSLGNAASRATEFHADRRAAQLGFGTHLLAAMRKWEAMSPRTDRGNVWERVVAAHPPMRVRINKLALYLRRYGQG